MSSTINTTARWLLGVPLIIFGLNKFLGFADVPPPEGEAAITFLTAMFTTYLAQSMVIFSESVILGEQLGLDKDFLLNVLPGLVVSAPFTRFKAEMIREDDYDVQFPLEWMLKDLHLAAITAYEAGQPLYLANLTKDLYAAAKREGMGRLDFAAIHRHLAG